MSLSGRKKVTTVPEIPGRNSRFTEERYDRYKVKASAEALEELVERDRRRLIEIKSKSGRLVMALERLN